MDHSILDTTCSACNLQGRVEKACEWVTPYSFTLALVSLEYKKTKRNAHARCSSLINTKIYIYIYI